MRITLDTNVLLSATFWYGDSNKIIELVEERKHVLVLSKAIFDEYNDIIARDEILSKVIEKDLERKFTVQKLVSISEIVSTGKPLDVVKDDPDDNIIVEAAYYGKADLIISQDKHLLNLKEYKGIKIITPEYFLNDYSKTNSSLQK